ncbi:MAG: hypothetical protein LBG69_06090 [Zoogloeaceae bacterium]|nr:hypothetical protein [Zoogloeaceae bacterium]
MDDAKNHIGEISIFADKCIVFKIKPITVLERGSVYEAARYYWKANQCRAERADYVLAVVDGVIKGVFEPSQWYVTTYENVEKYGGSKYWNEKYRERIGFIGKEADFSVLNRYLGKCISAALRAAQNPVLYSYK